MASEVSIINRALGFLGATKIVSRTQDSASAVAADAIFDDLRDDVLRDHPWNSVKRRAQLAAEVTAPLFGWDLSYLWPADCLRILSVNDVDWARRVGWAVEGRKILTDFTAPIDVEYCARITDPNEWDAKLRTAIALRLAAELAEPLTQQPEKQTKLLAAYERAKISAGIVDGLEEDPVENVDDSPLLAARWL